MHPDTRDTHDAFYRQTVTFAAKSERFWELTWPIIPADWVARQRAAYGAEAEARREQERAGRIGG